MAKKRFPHSAHGFESIFKHNPAPMALTALSDRTFIDVNDAYVTTLGYSREELVGKPSDEMGIFINPDQQKEAAAQLRAHGSIKNVEMQVRRKDGTILDGIFWGELIRDGNHTFFLTTMMDITKRKSAEEALRMSEEQLRNLIEQSPTSIQLLDMNGFTVRVNKAWEELWGVPWEKFKEFNFNMLEDEQLKKLGVIPYIEKAYSGEAVAIPAALYDVQKTSGVGNQRWVKANAYPVKDKSGNILNVVLAHEDITERKIAEDEKRKALEFAAEQSKNALVGQIAGKMAHDFNNILGVIMGNAELALMDCTDKDIERTLELIFEQTTRGKNLTRNLVAFAKDQEPKQTFFNLSEKVDLVISLMRKDLSGINLLRDNTHGIPELLADPGMIEHALVNLLQNSIHALSKTEQPQIILRTYHRDDVICFEIEDNGCGIAAEHLQRIYEPSFTLKGGMDATGSYDSDIKGTGYGMSNVRKYIKQHRGSVHVESEFGVGTKFTIALPVIKKELTEPEKTELRQSKSYTHRRILLVEDEPDISGVQYAILTGEPCNHNVDKANNGRDAIDLFDKNDYDFISLDYTLPGKINGMDVYRHIREAIPTVPILFMSGNIEFLESIKALKQNDPNLDHVSKPCPNKEYVNRINLLLEGARPPFIS